MSVSEKDLKPERKQLATYSPDVIMIKGADLQTRIFARCERIEQLHAQLLSKIAEMLRDAAGEGDVAEEAAVVLVALQDGYNLSAHAMAVQSFITRAASLQEAQRELIRFGKNLMPNAVYELSWNDADYFGV